MMSGYVASYSSSTRRASSFHKGSITGPHGINSKSEQVLNKLVELRRDMNEPAPNVSSGVRR